MGSFRNQCHTKRKRILITSHDAFRYLGESFSIEVVALQGISTLQEAGLADRANLVDFIKEKKVDVYSSKAV